jgi:hypothetical protein
MYVCSYMHINNTTCRVGSNTTPQQHDRVYSARMLSRKKMICIFLCRMPCLCRCCNLSTWSMLRLINLVNSTTYRLGRWCDISTWSMLRPMHLVDGTTHQLGRWDDSWTWLMVRPNGRTYPDTTYRLGRWYDQSTQDLSSWSLAMFCR